MVKPWLAGMAGLLMTSGVAVAQVAPYTSSTTTTTTQTTPVVQAPVYAPAYEVAPASTTITRVDHATSDENGLLTERTQTYKTQSVAPTVVVPPTTQTTTVERTVTVQPQ